MLELCQDSGSAVFEVFEPSKTFEVPASNMTPIHKVKVERSFFNI